MSAPTPKMTAAEAMEASLGLSLAALVEKVDEKIAIAVEAGVMSAVILTDRDIGRGTFIWNYCTQGQGHPVLRALIETYERAGYRVLLQPPPKIDGPASGSHPARISISWSRA